MTVAGLAAGIARPKIAAYEAASVAQRRSGPYSSQITLTFFSRSGTYARPSSAPQLSPRPPASHGGWRLQPLSPLQCLAITTWGW
jgi:hypothetical protein